jgi:hypothetical protein
MGVHKNLPQGHSQSNMNKLYNLMSCSCKIHLNIILQFTPKFSKWYLPFRVFDIMFGLIHIHSYACYMTRQFNQHWFYHPTNTCWKEKLWSPHYAFFFSISCYFLPAWYKCRPLRSGNTNEHRRTNIMLQHMYLLIKTKRNKSAEVWTYSCYFRTYMNIMLGFLHCLRCIWCKISETGSVYVVPYNGNNRTIEQEQPQYPIVERRRVQDTRYTTYTIISPQLSTTPHRKIREHIELIMTCKQKSPI